MIKAIIFDSDDTLIKYSKIGTKNIRQAAKNLGLYVPKKDEINKIYGRSFRFIVGGFWGDKNYSGVLREYKRLMLRYKLKEIHGAKRVVLLLSKKYRLALVSAKIKEIMIKNFKDIGLDSKVFKIMLSSEDTRYHKPDPRVFSRALRKLKVKRKEVLYVGDTLFDFMAAKKARFYFVAVTTGYFKRKDFIKARVKKQNILKSVRYLPAWIKKYDGQKHTKRLHILQDCK